MRRQGGIRPREQKLLESHRHHLQLLDFANRIRNIAQMNPEKRPSRTDREGRHLLREIFQRCQRTRAFLDFIEKNKVRRGINRPTLHKRQLLQNPVRLQRSLENIAEPRVLLKIDDVTG